MLLDVPDWNIEIDLTIRMMLPLHITISHDFIDLRIRTSGSVITLNAALGSSKIVESNNNLVLWYI